MPAVNTLAAKLQGTATRKVCTATASLLRGLDGFGSLSPQTASGLIFEIGQIPAYMAPRVTAGTYSLSIASVNSAAVLVLNIGPILGRTHLRKGEE